MTRLVLIVFVFLLSLFTVLKAPAYYIWLVSIMVTEFPWIFIGITALLLIWGFKVQHYQLQGTIVGLIALLLFLSPILRAYGVASNLNAEFESTFGKGSASLRGHEGQKPFSASHMLTGIGESLVPFKVLEYDDKYQLKLDFYPSQLPGNKPCVISVHGGSWGSGNSSELPELNSHLAKMGYNVAAINYRLAPQFQCPAPVVDIQTTIKYLKQHADELHIDTNNFVLLGRSAGGQIALLAAYTIHEPDLKAVISFYGPADMVWGYSIPSNPLIMDSRKVMDNYLGGSYSKVPHNYEASSPLLAVNKTSVPTLLIHGKNDVLVAYEHTRRLNAKLDQLGVKHFVLTLPWATHGCDYTLNGPSGQLSTYTIERFLNQVIK
jgi:acetyl esterase/lipase